MRRCEVAWAKAICTTSGPDKGKEGAGRAAVVAVGHRNEEAREKAGDGDRQGGPTGGAQDIGIEWLNMRQVHGQHQDGDDQHAREQ